MRNDSAAVFFAARLPAVETASAVPTQTIMTAIANPPTTRPIFTRRLVWRASHRWAKAPNSRVTATMMITGAGILVDALVSASTSLEVASYNRCASGRIVCCMSAEASERYDDPTGLPIRLLVRAVSIRPV